MDILDDMEVSKLSAKVFLQVNYFFKCNTSILISLNLQNLPHHIIVMTRT